MTIERADRQTAPLIAGRFYLVATVRAKWINRMGDWPVIGTLHEDRDILHFPEQHFHVDARFLPPSYKDLWHVFIYPLHARRGQPPLPAPVMKRRKCITPHVPWFVDWRRNTGPFYELRTHFAGRHCDKGKAGWICPHRHAALGSIQPEGHPEAGVITCPLHGLRIDAATGKVLAAD